MISLGNIAEYFVWADQTICDIIETLTDEEIVRPFGEYKKSIHSILCHLAEDHWWWYHYVTEQEFENEPDFENMSKDELLETISAYRQKWVDLTEGKPFEIFTMKRGEKSIPLSFEELIFHISNHATYHRGQLALALRFLGKEVPFTDYIPYLVQKGMIVE